MRFARGPLQAHPSVLSSSVRPSGHPWFRSNRVRYPMSSEIDCRYVGDDSLHTEHRIFQSLSLDARTHYDNHKFVASCSHPRVCPWAPGGQSQGQPGRLRHSPCKDVEFDKQQRSCGRSFSTGLWTVCQADYTALDCSRASASQSDKQQFCLHDAHGSGGRIRAAFLSGHVDGASTAPCPKPCPWCGPSRSPWPGCARRTSREPPGSRPGPYPSGRRGQGDRCTAC